MKRKKPAVRTLQLICGQAKPGANLAFLKNMMLFCREFNEKTKDKNGELVSVEIIVSADNTYSYNIGTPPSSHLIKKIIGDKKAITQAELAGVVKEIMPSLNTEDLARAKKIVAGTVRSFNGLKISE